MTAGRRRAHGTVAFLKRDNGSPFSTEAIDDLPAVHGILPFNSPICTPAHNGAIEHGIGASNANSLTSAFIPPLPHFAWS